MNYRNKSCQIVTIDVETYAHPPTDEQVGAYRLEVEKELTQEAAKKNRIENYMKNGALDFERARIVSIAMISDFDGEVKSFSHADEKEIALWFCDEVATMQQENKLEIRFAGFNIVAFDLPMIHLMLDRHDLTPPFRISKWAPIDLIYEPYGKSVGKKPLSYYLRCYRIPAKTHDGSEVAGMWEEDVKNNTKHVEQYNRADAEKEYALLTKMARFYEF